MAEKKEKRKIVSPLYETNPFPLGEVVSEQAEEDAVKMAKKWVDENHI